MSIYAYMNQNTVDQLAERTINETNSAVSCLTLYLGHKLDLFNSLGKEGPITSEELSKKTKYSERYVREWLECMTANGYIDYDPITKRFGCCVIVIVFHTQSLLYIGLPFYH
jgi:hypothetical protein